ncbi:hypothetical protein CONLIGDRAFT_634943 [Coniochaeta ligniaria NRRL 30616]|uniref:Uncharacterized protein n=1 Tax=Coniochaeta ligniaria NRRL 30616 TaxID=1408157 RepID=A0A1J7IH43_9PEZI|nr:hypothetical protein CONLIGDRAFT_634943 [Coniochaeta ligniaria NRRL 30616]
MVYLQSCTGQSGESDLGRFVCRNTSNTRRLIYRFGSAKRQPGNLQTYLVRATAKTVRVCQVGEGARILGIWAVSYFVVFAWSLWHEHV